ncbi:MAG: MFS transporter [Fimbriimonadaceae bacterium]|nr:MFS transporter [Fimbriimonadaceae bacterium]
MHRRVWHLGWISFFADISSEMAYPAIPLFLKNVLKAPVAAIGLVEGVAEALVSIMKGLSGIHSDRSGRRTPYLQWGYGLSALGKPMIALATVWPMVLLARVTDRLGKGIRTPARDALLADTVDASRRGEAFGIHRAMDTAGALVGVLLALALLYWMPDGYRTLFLLAAIPGAISVVLTLRLTEATPVEDPETGEPAPRPAPISVRDLPRGYWRALALAIVFALGNSSDTFLLLRAQNLGYSAAAAIGAYALYNVTYALLSRPMGLLSDRLGRWRVLGAGWLVYAGVYVGFATLGAHAVWPLFAVYGIYMGFTDGVGKALVADHAPAGSRGTALGFFYFASGFATLASSLIAGLLWDRIGAAAPFWFGAACAVVAAALIPVTRPRAMV